ncbi:MAG TPA: hypothetical protein VK600_01010 [Candidatus Saccharimonadales bacterium]|nr:hypothetical protein [Candidatus Saccharimonadales bacterium]
MTPDSLMLARLLSLAALMAATIEYTEVLKHRVVHRTQAFDRALLQESGLRGLARVFLSESETLAPAVLRPASPGEREYWCLARFLARSNRYM